MGEEPRYTIEQIELLRRLIHTGLSRDDIIHAFDSMTRLEREFGGYSPHSTSRPDQSPLHSPVSVQQASPQSSATSSRFDLGQPSADHVIVQADVDTTSYVPQIAQPTQAVSSGPIGRNSTGRLQDIAPPTEADGSQERYVNRLKVDEFQVADVEIQALLSKGLPAVRDEIREFLAKNNLSQNQLGRDIGVTGSYISQYFHSVRSMRNGTIALMCKWYIGKQRELDAGVSSAAVTPPAGSQYHQTNYDNFIRAPTNRFSPYSHSNIELAKNFKIRRERFVWKDSCTKVLESYFKKNPYPNDLERIRLSDACNALQQIPGHAVPESCIVTPERVYHWFANRRKELNKRKRLSEIIPVSISQSQEVLSSSVEDAKHSDESQALTFPVMSSQRDEAKDNRDGIDSEQVIDLDEDDDHPRDPKEIANQLQEVNNSIITFMKAVEEKTDEEELENKADVALLHD